MTLLDWTPWWWTRKEDQKEGSAPLKAYTFGNAEQKGNFFWWLLSQLCSPKDREIFQPEKWWKPHQRLGMAWHNMISAWCVEGWLVPALVKENLTKKLHWLKSRADISTTTTPEDESFLYMQCYHRSLPTWATACWYRKGISKFNAFYMKPVSFTTVSNN